MSNVRGRSQPLTFRQEEVGYVMERWRAAESCSLVGVGSVGKSNLLQHLADPETQAYYMKDVAQGKLFRAIIIDPNMLGPLPSGSETHEQFRCWAGYELMMHRLFLALYPFDMLPADEARLFYETYQALQDGANPLFAYIGLRYFELGLELFMKRGVQIVFMFDEFEELVRQMPVKFFTTLRGLRDANKRLLSYLTFSRSPISEIANRFDLPPLEFEPFGELFTDHVYFVGPYNDADARAMIQQLMRRADRQYDDYTVNFLLWATGRFAGLLRAAFRSLETFEPLDSHTLITEADQLARQIVNQPAIRTECLTIWRCLSSTERDILRELCKPDPRLDTSNAHVKEAFTILSKKKLVRVQSNRVVVEPPLFALFIKSNPDQE